MVVERNVDVLYNDKCNKRPTFSRYRALRGMYMARKWLVRTLLALASVSLVHCKVETASPFSKDLEPFYGTYTGTSEPSVISGEIAERDLTVTIQPLENNGFKINWTTVIYKANGQKKKSAPSINFLPSSRPGLFASAMKTDVFGHTVPYDPISEEGNPYVWAGLDDTTLTVSALYIIDGGSYEMHVYKRSLNGSGLSLKFERIKDGKSVTQISAQLDPVSR